MARRAFYGDLETSRIFAIDVDTMSRIVEEDIPINAPAYPVDSVTPDVLYAITRGVKSVTPINIRSYTARSPIELSHRPRSTATKKVGKSHLCLIAGADEPVTSVLDVSSERVIQSVGLPGGPTSYDYGGTLASGHPMWIDRNNFFVIDRRRRRISIYALNQSLPLWSFQTPTSCHHIEVYRDGYVALCEGNVGSRIPPSLVFFSCSKRSPSPKNCSVNEVLFMPSSEGGAHHIGIIGNTIYVPTSNGFVYVVEPAKSGFKFCKPIKAGAGSGHVFFNPQSKMGVGVIVNHTDKFVTLFDQEKHVAIKNVEVASLPPAGKKSQAHTSAIGAGGRYFYGAASLDGEFYRIDLRSRTKDTVLDLDTYGAKANPLQGSFV